MSEPSRYAFPKPQSRSAARSVADPTQHTWESRARRGGMELTRAYLYVAAKNRALKYLRHRRVATAWIERAARAEPPTASSPEDLYLRRELADAVRRAIAELPARCRDVFVLRRHQHLSYNEIAARAGVSLGTVKSQMWRATVLLKEKLAPYLFILQHSAA